MGKLISISHDEEHSQSFFDVRYRNAAALTSKHLKKEKASFMRLPVLVPKSRSYFCRFYLVNGTREIWDN